MTNNIIRLLMMAFIFTSCGKSVTLEVSNPSAIERNGEVVEVDFASVKAKLELPDGEAVVLTDASGKQLPYQITKDNQLIFPATVNANGTAAYTVKCGTPESFETMAQARFVPERFDDYAWENNHTAYRLYGKALIAKDGPSNGVDVWSKRGGKMVIDEWYGYASKNISYHKDNGTGGDAYKVGRTLGGGMPAPLLNDTLVLGENFDKWETLENGPLRASFKVTYSPLKVGEEELIETREISINANSYFCKIVAKFAGKGPKLDIAAGITLHAGEGVRVAKPEQASVEIWEKLDGDLGMGGVAVVMPKAFFKEGKEIQNHICAITSAEPGQPVTYFIGSGWEKNGFPTANAWSQEVANQSVRIEKPLAVMVK